MQVYPHFRPRAAWARRTTAGQPAASRPRRGLRLLLLDLGTCSPFVELLSSCKRAPRPASTTDWPFNEQEWGAFGSRTAIAGLEPGAFQRDKGS